MSNKKETRVTYAVGSVAQRAVEGAGSLLAAAREDVSDINREEPELEIPNIPDAPVPESPADDDDTLEIPDTVLASVWFSENQEPPAPEQLDLFEDALIDAIVQDQPVFEFDEKVYSFDKAARLEVAEEDREKRSFGGMVKKLMKKLTKAQKTPAGASFSDAVTKVLKGDPAENLGNNLLKFKKFKDLSIRKGPKGFFGKLGRKFKDGNLTLRTKSGKFKNFKSAFKKLSRPMGGLTQPESLGFSAASNELMANLKVPASSRMPRAEGGEMAMPPELVDTYPNIPPEEMAAVEASQLPDEQMEQEYEEFILDEALNELEQDYLLQALEKDENLSTIFDRVMDVATEFSGAGAVKGNGTGVSDSIPARLSDGEFVFTKKAVDQIGAEALQQIMDEAERAYDQSTGRLQKQVGGLIDDEDPTSYDKRFLGSSEVSEDLKKAMIASNQMPRQR
jgi:hypothetical protein